MSREEVTYRLEGNDLGVLCLVIDSILHVVDCQTTIGSLELIVTQLRNALVATILCTEIEHCSPVIRKVVDILAGCADRFTWHVFLGIHGSIEGIL